MGAARFKLLAIDDNPDILQLIRENFRGSNLEVLTASDALTGLEIFFRVQPQIVISDALMPSLSGLQILNRILAADPAVDVILLAEHYSADAAVEAIRQGATDYLAKPLDVEKLQSRVRGLMLDAERRQEVMSLERELVESYQFEGIIGRSPGILDVFARIRRVAPHFRVLLIKGATGTGKELVARALHNRSQRGGKPFVACNCSALVDTLLETELIGHVKGAFTGADRDKIGLFEYANGGTVFLDEIGDMPLGAQAKLLRVLQNEEIQRVGSPKTHPIDTHVVAATNRDLKKMVAEGTFREDLYYRLAVVELTLPTLSDRKEDLPLLQRHFVEKYAMKYRKNISGLTRRAQLRLSAHTWPGNVRELENVIANACMMVEGNLVDVKDLPDSILRAARMFEPDTPELLSMHKMQERHLMRVLNYTSGNKAKAAEILGISRETIYSILARISKDVHQVS